MEIEMTPEQEAHLAQIAAHLHNDPHQLVVDENDRFRASLRKGIEEADRGEVIDEAEMDAPHRTDAPALNLSFGLYQSMTLVGP